MATTDYLYTGQRNESEIGLDWYTSRMYDPALGRFIQPDSLIPDPGSSKGYDRYAYVNNNPINFNDPSGHKACTGREGNEGCDVDDDWEHDKNDTVASNDPWAFRHADQTSQEGLEFLKNEEGGPKLMPYGDQGDNNPNSHCTIGYGTLLYGGLCDPNIEVSFTLSTGETVDVDPQKGITSEQAYDLMIDYIKSYIEPVIQKKITTPLFQYQFDALVSYMYNLGPGWLTKQLVDYINNRDFDSAANYMMTLNLDSHDNPLDALKRRRDRENKLFLKASYGYE